MNPEILSELERLAVDEPEAYQELLQVMQQPATEPAPTIIRPEPGFVIKTTYRKLNADESHKLFINLCHSDEIPAPPPATTDEIRAAIDSGDCSLYRIPLSLMGPREDVDRGNIAKIKAPIQCYIQFVIAGRPCLVFDACVHSDPFSRCSSEFEFRAFLIHLSMEWIEQKHSLLLSREFTLPKMRCKGELSDHRIYRAKRPRIESLPESTKEKRPAPGFTLKVEPPSADPPEFIIVTVDLSDRVRLVPLHSFK